MVYSIVTMTALMMFISLAVDLGRVQLVKTELQRAADAAARYGVSGLSSGITTAQTRAADAADDNTADGTPVILNSTTDIEFGTWNTSTQTFTVLAGTARANANSLRITARRTAASGNAVPLLFAKVMGMNACNVTATSVAMLTKPPSFTGTGGITMGSNNFVASYKSSVVFQPGTTTFNSNGTLGSNGAISGVSGNSLKGSVTLGSAGSVAGVSITGTTTTGGTIQDLIVPAMTPVSNPGSVSVAPNVSGSVSWPGGTYYFTSFQMQNSALIQFTGPATINLNGNGTLGTNTFLLPYNYVPGNLVWRMASGKIFTVSDVSIVGCNFIAPGGTFTMHDFGFFGGSIFAKQITLHDYCQLYADEDLVQQSTSISMTK